MTEQTERQMQQQKWQKFADVLRHSVDAEHQSGNASVERSTEDQQQAGFDSVNGLKSPVLSDEQQSDFTDLAVDESSNGVAEDGFELVINKRNRTQKQKQMNGNVWSGASASHLKELHSSSSSSTTAPHSTSTNSSSSQSKLRVTSTTASSKNAQNKTLTTKTSQYGVIRCLEEGGAENNEQDMSNSSDSAFAENQSPSHGSSTSLHFIASEAQNFSDSVALSDDEKWPELSVATKNDPNVKSTTSPTSPKLIETKSSTPVDENPSLSEKDTNTLNRRGQKAQWKKVEIDINYGKPNDKKHGSSKRNFRPHAGSEGELTQRRNTTGSYKRRPQSRKSNMSSSDVESQNNNELDSVETHNKGESNESAGNNQSKADINESENFDGSQNQYYDRRDNKQNDPNNRGYKNNNNYRQDPQYNDYNNRRQMRNPRVSRHSVPNLFNCQTTVPIYFLSQDYAAENFIQPLPNTAAPPYIYSNMPNMMLPTAYPDMGYANAPFLNDYSQQNMFQYRSPFVQMPIMPQNGPYINTSIPAIIPESVQMPEEQNLEEELSHLLRRVFIDDNEKTLRDLTENPNIIAQMNFQERCLLLLCQMQFYFSAENLAKDVFLRRHMNEEGFVSLGLFLTFPRIKNLGIDSNTIVNSLLHSQYFELRMSDQDIKIRAKSLDWPSSTNLNSSENVSPAINMASPQQAESSKRPSQPINTNEEISVDDVRARLIQGRAKQSPSSTIEHSLPDDASPNNQTTNETDQWTVYKKKNRPSANGSVTESTRSGRQ